ncbi:MAG: methyltransferase domain-containing protein [Desulfohalobiaceae bacterium]|nr:methyltransferase domain-containing protein [Desulfohalobiaceae bacterium]
MQKKDIFSEVRGFMISRAILTAAELDVFTSLDNGLETAKELSQAKGLNERNTARLLDSMVVSGYLDKDRGGYRLTERGAYLSANHSSTVLPMVRHMIHVWDNWSMLTDTVIQGVNTERESVTEMDRDKQRDFVEAMHVVGRDLAQQIAEFYGETSCSSLLDIGGGSGVYSLAFLRRNPSMQAVIFDLPQVIPVTEECISQEPESDRITLFPGDFYQDELPTGCDMALLSAIIHQNGPQQNLELYRKVYRALEPGGILLIRDHIMDETRTRPQSGAIFALNMLVNTESGDTYTFEEVRNELEQAGFEQVRAMRVGGESLEEMDCLVEARKTA